MICHRHYPYADKPLMRLRPRSYWQAISVMKICSFSLKFRPKIICSNNSKKKLEQIWINTAKTWISEYGQSCKPNPAYYIKKKGANNLLKIKSKENRKGNTFLSLWMMDSLLSVSSWDSTRPLPAINYPTAKRGGIEIKIKPKNK